MPGGVFVENLLSGDVTIYGDSSDKCETYFVHFSTVANLRVGFLHSGAYVSTQCDSGRFAKTVPNWHCQ